MTRKRGRRHKGRVGAGANDIPEYTDTKANLDALEDNSEDEFYKQRDSLAFDELESSTTRRGGANADDSDGEEEEEVFALQGVDDDEDDDEDEDEALLERMRRHGVRPKGELRGDEDDDENDDGDGGAGGRDAKGGARGADAGGWGKSRDGYYDGDDISDEEDAKAVEQEALRMQREQFDALGEDDFLEDTFESLLKKKRGAIPQPAAHSTLDAAAFDLDDADAGVEQIKPDLSRLSEAEKIKLVRSTHPEMIELLNEFKTAVEEMQNETPIADPEDPRSVSQLARYLYLTNLAFYFALAIQADAHTRKTHPVVEHLASLQELVEATASGVGDGMLAQLWAYDGPGDAAAIGEDGDGDDDDEDHDIEEDVEEEDDEEEDVHYVPAVALAKKHAKLHASTAKPSPLRKAKQSAHSTTKTGDAEPQVSLLDGAAIEVPLESYSDVHVPKTKTKSNDKTVAAPAKRKRSETRFDNGDENDFGEADEIDSIDLADKLRRKKSLQFHVNQIDQSVTNLRTLKKKVHAGGDDDLPKRDVRASEQAAMEKAQREQHKVQRRPDGSDADSGDAYGDGDDDEYFGGFGRKGRAVDSASGSGSGDDQYEEEGEQMYQQMVAAKNARRAEREAVIEMSRAEMDTDYDPDAVGEGGKRQANWQILANRGLTPHRKKENRNPRVKKRMKYEQAKKKLGSVRRIAVDKRKLGSYAGETTGINVNRSSSVKFN